MSCRMQLPKQQFGLICMTAVRYVPWKSILIILLLSDSCDEPELRRNALSFDFENIHITGQE